ncbi:unnamed protein product [Calicophoron daubneyi]|uniref:Uncharacterized protein n=1 Tax=Calicophoron daubneyi TaxID=300641 RepID=A0AAV2T608_CALDB
MGEKKSKYEIPGDLSEWMTKLPPRLKAEPLNKLGIPGTHISASYSIHRGSPISGEHPEYLQIGPIPIHRRPTRHNWTRTQYSSVYEQLEHGVRFIDLHVLLYIYQDKYKERIHEYYCVNGQLANTVNFEIDMISMFLEKHPEEVVIIYVSYGHNFILTKDSEAFMDIIVKKFHRCMCPPQDTIPSLDFMRKHAYQVILFSQVRSKEFKHYFDRVWPEGQLQVFEKRTTNGAEIINYFESVKEDRNPEKFCVHYAALYPTLEFMLDHRRESLYDAQKDLADRLWSWIRNPERVGGEKGVNIIAVDYMVKAYPDLPARMIEGSYEVFLTRFALSECKLPVERRVTEDAARPDSSKSNSSRSDSAASQNR